MQSADEHRVFLSLVSLAELGYGVEGIPAGARRNRIEHWLQDELPLRFEYRILPIDHPIAEAWGKVVSRRKLSGVR
jgi:toxin FitB